MTDSITFNCWRCGGLLEDTPMPLSRTEMCTHCRADIHVCKQCAFYDTSKASDCGEPIAEHVTDKVRANFCGYLVINKKIDIDTNVDSRTSDDLNALFGLENSATAISPNQSDQAQAALDELFGLTENKKE